MTKPNIRLCNFDHMRQKSEIILEIRILMTISNYDNAKRDKTKV